jgi:hypothetical protein
VFLRWVKRDDTSRLKLAALDQQLVRGLDHELVGFKQAFGEVGDGMLEPQRHLVSGELEDHPENNAAHVPAATTKQ